MSHDPQSPTDAADFDVERPFCAYIGGTCTGTRMCCDDPAGDHNEYDADELEDEFDCGAWFNGKFDFYSCQLAETEDCDRECPYSAGARGLKA